MKVRLWGDRIKITPEEVEALSRCADNAERWAATRMWDERDHKAHETARLVIAKLRTLLPEAT